MIEKSSRSRDFWEKGSFKNYVTQNYHIVNVRVRIRKQEFCITLFLNELKRYCDSSRIPALSINCRVG